MDFKTQRNAVNYYERKAETICLIQHIIFRIFLCVDVLALNLLIFLIKNLAYVLWAFFFVFNEVLALAILLFLECISNKQREKNLFNANIQPINKGDYYNK